MKALLFTAKLDDREGSGVISSRIGIKKNAIPFSATDNLYEIIHDQHLINQLGCILVDEAQFLNRHQVEELTRTVDHLGIPVLTYGIRTDFKGEVFEGSKFLMAWADEIREIKTICHCGKKATMNARVSSSGVKETAGEQIEIGGNERYISLCRKCFTNGETGFKFIS
jgi:thymidine kinase